MKKWAFKDEKCKMILAKNVLKDNYGSQKVLLKNGFILFSHKSGKYNYKLKRFKE